MTRVHGTAIVMAALMMSCSTRSCGQVTVQSDVPFVLGERLKVSSKVLGMNKQISVWRPPALVGPDPRRFPVIYVLDNDFLGTVTAVMAQMAEERMPPSIVVAVGHADRNLDLTPPLRTKATVPIAIRNHGGADNFLKFFETELIPTIERRYPTAPFRVLIGHSLGGLFALHAATVKPRLFNAFIVMEPSVWWDSATVVSRLEQSLRASSRPPLRLVAGERNTISLMRSYIPALRALAGPRGDVSFFDVPFETHTGMQYIGRYIALRALFSAYEPEYHADPSKASVDSLLRQYRELSARWGFEVTPPLDALEELRRREAIR